MWEESYCGVFSPALIKCCLYVSGGVSEGSRDLSRQVLLFLCRFLLNYLFLQFLLLITEKGGPAKEANNNKHSKNFIYCPLSLAIVWPPCLNFTLGETLHEINPLCLAGQQWLQQWSNGERHLCVPWSWLSREQSLRPIIVYVYVVMRSRIISLAHAVCDKYALVRHSGVVVRWIYTLRYFY